MVGREGEEMVEEPEVREVLDETFQDVTHMRLADYTVLTVRTVGSLVTSIRTAQNQKTRRR